MTFEQLSNGDTFTCNGTIWRKRSSRTATLWPVRPGAGELGATWCYFSASDRVNHRLDSHLIEELTQ
tara:strand:- start:1276 stop:1476 length:201 start_codon:yes stop_codon:yes gene_type:complete